MHFSSYHLSVSLLKVLVSKLRRPLALLVLCGEVSLEVRTVALDPAVNGLLAPVYRHELTELAGDLLLAGDAKLRAQLGEVGEDGVVGPGVVSLTRAQNAAEAVAIGVHGLVLPCGRLRERNELPNEGLNRRLRQQVVGSCLHLPLLIGVSVDGPIRERLEPLGAPRVQGVGTTYVYGSAVTGDSRRGHRCIRTPEDLGSDLVFTTSIPPSKFLTLYIVFEISFLQVVRVSPAPRNCLEIATKKWGGRGTDVLYARTVPIFRHSRAKAMSDIIPVRFETAGQLSTLGLWVSLADMQKFRQVARKLCRI